MFDPNLMLVEIGDFLHGNYVPSPEVWSGFDKKAKAGYKFYKDNMYPKPIMLDFLTDFEHYRIPYDLLDPNL